jgi:hypothetical protein
MRYRNGGSSQATKWSVSLLALGLLPNAVVGWCPDHPADCPRWVGRETRRTTLYCVQVSERMPAYLANGLSAEQVRDVDRHLAKCPGCRAKYEAARREMAWRPAARSLDNASLAWASHAILW